MREKLTILCLGSGLSAVVMDLMTVRHSRNGVLDDAEDNRNSAKKIERAVRGLKHCLRNPSSEGGVMREKLTILCLGSGLSAVVMDLMTVRHSRNGDLDDAEGKRKHSKKNERALRALKQGLGNPPSEGGVMREEARFFLRGAVSVLK